MGNQRFNRVVTLTPLVLTLSAHDCELHIQSSQLPNQVTARAKTSSVHTLVQNRHLIIGTSCPTGHCEKGGRMVMPACSPITGICASLTLESVKLEVKLSALTTLRVVTPTILGGRDPTSCSAHTWQDHGVHRVHNHSHHRPKTPAGMSTKWRP